MCCWVGYASAEASVDAALATAFLLCPVVVTLLSGIFPFCLGLSLCAIFGGIHTTMWVAQVFACICAPRGGGNFVGGNHLDFQGEKIICVKTPPFNAFRVSVCPCTAYVPLYFFSKVKGV